MSMRVVFLDRAPLKAKIRALDFASQYAEYDAIEPAAGTPQHLVT